ncbi:MAG TPA: AAA family ATPase [Acidimicrobiia bacterium]|nr:AAA family ATPase [Acidimicrobiia bacterium]
MLTVNLLGAPEALSDGVPIRVDTNKAIALLAYLVVERTARRDTLAALLWAESSQERARATLRRTLSALRTAVGADILQADRSTVALSGTVRSDYGELLDELSATAGHDHDTGEVCGRCVPHLERASALYRGDFLQGFGVRSAPEFEDWSRSIGQSLRIRMGNVFERLASAHAAAGDYAAATTAAARWIDLDPLHEPAYRLLMLLRAWAGDRSGAIDAYRECVSVLDRELAVPPLEETTELYEAILDEDLPPAPGVRRRVTTTRVPARAPTGLIDREAEVAALREALATASERGVVVSVAGAPWMGKTRLAEELIAEAGPDRLVLTARGYRLEQSLPYGVIAQMLDHASPHLDEAGLADWAAGELGRIVPGLGQATAPEPLGERRLLEAIHTSIAALATRRPLLVVIDDAQWADEPSAAVIAYLAHRVGGLPVLLMVIAREDEGVPAPIADVIASAGVRLVLRPLSVEQLIPLTGDEEAARALESRTGGVPLLAAEAVESGGGTPTPGMTRYLEARWNELGDLERQLLSAAAVLGGSCDTRLLKETSGRSEDEVVQGVEHLTRLGLLEETPDGVGFTLDAMERVAYESVSLVRRRLLHGRAAEAISARPNARREARLAAAVANHLQEAGRPEAADWHMTAGELARSVYAHDSARSFYESALALGTDRVAEARLALAEIEMALGRYEEARRQLTLAEGSAGEIRAVVAQRLGDVERLLGRFGSAEAHYETALEAGAPPVEVLSDWALLAMRTGRHEEAVELATRARDAAERGGRPGELSRVGNILAAVTTDPAEALEHAEEAARLAGDDEMLLMAALNGQALILADRGELNRAVAVLETAIEIAVRTGHRHREAALWSHLADIHHRAGREDEARELQTRAISMFADIDAGGFEPELWLLTRW